MTALLVAGWVVVAVGLGVVVWAVRDLRTDQYSREKR